MGSPLEHLQSKHNAMRVLLENFEPTHDWSERYRWLIVTSLDAVALIYVEASQKATARK